MMHYNRNDNHIKILKIQCIWAKISETGIFTKFQRNYSKLGYLTFKIRNFLEFRIFFQNEFGS